MQTIGAFEAKTHLSALLNQVEAGIQIIITKHGKPIAKLMPITNTDQETIQQSIQRLKKFGQGNKLAGLDWKKLKNEGRK